MGYDGTLWSVIASSRYVSMRRCGHVQALPSIFPREIKRAQAPGARLELLTHNDEPSDISILASIPPVYRAVQ